MKWLLLLCLFACNAFAASSEGLVTPFTSIERYCSFKVEVISRAAMWKGDYPSAEAMLSIRPFPDSWSDELRNSLTAEINGLFSFTGSNTEYIQQRYKACMGEKT